jgi:hypothetical protein
MGVKLITDGGIQGFLIGGEWQSHQLGGGK